MVVILGNSGEEEDEEEVVKNSKSYYTQSRVILLLFLLYVCAIFLRILSYHHGHICATLALILAVLSFWHRSLSSTLEFLFISIMYILKVQLTFPIFQVLKMVISFLFFLLEFPLHTPKASRLRYLLGLKSYLWQSCHSAIAIDDDIYHYSFGNSNANTQDRSFNLVPKTSPSIWLRKAMFAPCVGLAVLHEKQQLMQKLQACGKCHDWAVVSLYLLSYNKFLTYSVLTPLRWTTWIIFGFNILTICIYTSHYDYIVVDCMYLLCTIVDVLNLTEERLTASNKEQNRGSWWDHSKLVALGLLSWMFCQAQWNLANWGFIFFVGTSTCLCVLVHLILENSSSVRHDQ